MILHLSCLRLMVHFRLIVHGSHTSMDVISHLAYLHTTCRSCLWISYHVHTKARFWLSRYQEGGIVMKLVRFSLGFEWHSHIDKKCRTKYVCSRVCVDSDYKVSHVAWEWISQTIQLEATTNFASAHLNNSTVKIPMAPTTYVVCMLIIIRQVNNVSPLRSVSRVLRLV